MKNFKKVTCGGAVGIPIAIRREMGLHKGDPLELELKGDRIVIKPYSPRCVFCEKDGATFTYKGKKICHNCLQEITVK